MPVAFRISTGLLIAAAVGGQDWQRRPAGTGTAAVLTTVGSWCPGQFAKREARTIADGARAIDGCAYRLLRQRLADEHARGRLTGDSPAQ